MINAMNFYTVFSPADDFCARDCPTDGVTRLGWEGGVARETGFRQSQENA
jgi:hypothetical protein